MKSRAPEKGILDVAYGNARSMKGTNGALRFADLFSGDSKRTWFAAGEIIARGSNGYTGESCSKTFSSALADSVSGTGHVSA
jgi:hypothetical protein